MKRRALAGIRALIAAAIVLTACTPAPDCNRVGGTAMLEYQLFFARTLVTDQQWADFTAKVITPNLPDGFTVLDADGQWMNPATSLIHRERTKVVIVAVPDTPNTRTAIARIKDEYRQRFHQVAVGTAIHPVCAAF